MKKKKILIIALLICLAFLLMYLINAQNVIDIKEVKYNKIGNNLYYIESDIEDGINRNEDIKEDKKTILNYYNSISNYMQDNYPNKTLLIQGFTCGNFPAGRICGFSGEQLINKVLITDSYFGMNFINGEISFDKDLTIIEFFDIDINLDNLISHEEIEKISLDLARKNYHKMDPKNRNRIYGEYYLIYDIKHGTDLYYYVQINDINYIEINPKNGEVVSLFFTDGMVE